MWPLSNGGTSDQAPSKESYKERLLAYVRDSDRQADVFVTTGYTYAQTGSYLKSAIDQPESTWQIPFMMSRRTTKTTTSKTQSSSSSSRTVQVRENLLVQLPEQEQHLLAMDREEFSDLEELDQDRNLAAQGQGQSSSFTSRIASSVRSVFSTPKLALNGNTLSGSTLSGSTLSASGSSLSSPGSLTYDVLTRSQCDPKKCSAGCELHHHRRKRKPKQKDDASTNTESVSDLGERLALLSDDDDNNQGNDFTPENFTQRTSSTPVSRSAANGIGNKPNKKSVPWSATRGKEVRKRLQSRLGGDNNQEEPEVEELTIVRRITRIFNSNTHSTYDNPSIGQRLNDMTPEPVSRITKSIPKPILVAILLIILSLGIYLFEFYPSLEFLSHIQNSISSFAVQSSKSIYDNIASLIALVIDFGANSWFLISSSICNCWISISNLFTAKSEPSFVYNADDDLDKTQYDRINEAMARFSDQIKSLDSRLDVEVRLRDKMFKDVDKKILNQDEQSRMILDEIDIIKKSCCKDESEITKLVLSNVKSFWYQLFPSMKSDLSDNDLRLAIKDQVSLIAKSSVIGHASHELQEFNDRFQRKLDESVTRVMNQIQDLKSQIRDNNQQSDKISSSDKTSSYHDDGDLSRDMVKKMILDAISTYDADKTGQHDFALEPSGGTVVNIRCSETYNPMGIQYSIFGIPIWATSNSPRTVIQPSISPGQCWAFKGHEGHLVIKLSRTITPTAFVYEHIPRSISRDGHIDSAPRLFQVRGLKDENDKEGVVLGNYEYLDNDQPLQIFPIQEKNSPTFDFIEFIILSNYGNPEYTCLYRFRVHGIRSYY